MRETRFFEKTGFLIERRFGATVNFRRKDAKMQSTAEKQEVERANKQGRENSKRIGRPVQNASLQKASDRIRTGLGDVDFRVPQSHVFFHVVSCIL